MEKNTKIQEQQQAAVVTQTVQQQKQTAASALDKLREYGGFTFLENIIDGFSNLNGRMNARHLLTGSACGSTCFRAMSRLRRCATKQKTKLCR